MKRIIKNILGFIGFMLLAFALSLIFHHKEIYKAKEIENHNEWVNAGVIDHKEIKNNSLIVVENEIK